MEETSWFMTKQEIEEKSPSRIDNVDLNQENFQRWSYTTFLQELGQRLKNPQKTIWTSIVYCQRFFTRESLGKNDGRMTAIICMFIAGKVEGSPRPVGDVIAVGYRVLHDKDPSRLEFEKMKQDVLRGEKFVMSTLKFELKNDNPYDLVFEWVKRSFKFEPDGKKLVQVAINFVNDGLRSSICLQFRASQIAAAAIFLGSSFVKVKLPWDGEKVWWKEFNVTKRQLWEISNQTLYVYEQDFLAGPVKCEKLDERKEIKDEESKPCFEEVKGNAVKVAEESRNVVKVAEETRNVVDDLDDYYVSSV